MSRELAATTVNSILLADNFSSEKFFPITIELMDNRLINTFTDNRIQT